MRRGTIMLFITLVLMNSLGFDKVSNLNDANKDVKQTYVKYNGDKSCNDNFHTYKDERIIKDKKDKVMKLITPMKALDLVKGQYAKDFERIYYEDTPTSYFYKLPKGNYYLTYDSFEEQEGIYIIHLYEYVVDDQKIEPGHAVTYGWYGVNQKTGQITDRSDY